MTHEGYVRFIAHKIVEDGRSSVEVFEQETFDIKLVTQRFEHGPLDLPCEMIADCGYDEPLLLVLEKYPDGYYEVVGEFHYEYDPGTDTPDGPADPNSWWWIEKENIAVLTEEQADWYLPKKALMNNPFVLDKTTK